MTASALVPRFLLLFLLLGISNTCGAVDTLSLGLGHIQGAGWQAAGAQLQVDLASGLAELRVTELALPAPVGKVRELRIRCPKMVMDNQAISCEQARFHLGSAWLKPEDFQGSFHFVQKDGSLRFALQKLALGRGRVNLQGQYTADGWQVSLQGQALQLADLLKNAGNSMKLPADLTLEGGADVKLSVAGGEKKPLTVDADLAIRAATLSASDGALASDKLVLALKGSTQKTLDGWSFSATVQAPSGQAYIEPVFLDFAPAPLKATMQGRWTTATNRLALETFHVDQADTLQAGGTLTMQFADTRRIESLQLAIERAQLPGAYTRYFQPFLIGTMMDSLETAGRVSGTLAMQDNRPRLIALRLEGLQLDDSKRRFALYGANGDINWSADVQTPVTSQLKWEGGSGYKVDFGPAEFRLRTIGTDATLLGPTRIPLLDGALQIKRLELSGMGRPDMGVSFDGVLEPVSMEKLCSALGWPSFGGKLAGSLPTLEYRDSSLTVGGTLRADVFDGRVEVDRLRLEQPFGSLPKLSADMKMRNLDLEAATSAFSFGRITGRLDGDVKNLQLLKWQPVAFDGRLYTSPGDKSRHRISQRAIENISNLGGNGAAGVLSRGFLRFFKDFAYDRLALGCRLQNGVCQMSGLEPAQGKQAGGYTIVKGSLVPRIDVIGFASQVNWDSFLQQLKSVTQSEGPVVK